MINESTQGFHPQSWSQAVAQLTEQNCDFVLVTIIGSAGSTPRATGTKMVVTASDIFDTVGGGHLEFKLIERARNLLTSGVDTSQIEHFPLGASLGQCCGGSVTILFEPIVSHRLSVEVYGAGHVAHHLISLLQHLPVSVRWIDSRANLFPETLPKNVTTYVEPYPCDQIKHAQPNSVFVILTHNHQLDFELCEAVLKRGDSALLGVIGSSTKAKRFTMRLAHKNYSEADIAHLTCPIGLEAIQGKLPMEVAVSITAQIMQVYQSEQAEPSIRNGLAWSELKNDLTISKAVEKT
jgi:xanthine dehydrogenase accessory factor